MSLKMANVRLVYISPSRIPGRAANSFQVMKMAETLMRLAPNMLLLAADGDTAMPADDAELARFYGVSAVPRIESIPTRGRFAIHLFNLRAAVRAKRNDANLVLSRSIGAAALAAWFGIPTIWECHAPPDGFERRYWNMLIRARGFRRLVVISDALKQLMIERYPEAAKLDIVVAHDGVDLDRFAGLPSPGVAKAATGRDPARPVAAYAGHLYAGRGIDIIIACAEALPDWTFLIAGGTPADIAALERALAVRNLTNVELLGFIDNSVLPDRLASADALLMPYQRRVMVSGGKLDTARWMSPLKMFEYLAMGRAIVASDLEVLHEVLTGKTAILVQPDAAGAWIDALRILGSDEARRRSLSEAAAQCATHYTWQSRTERILGGLVGVS